MNRKNRKSRKRRVGSAELTAIAEIFPEGKAAQRDFDERRESNFCRMLRVGCDMHSGKTVDLRL